MARPTAEAKDHKWVTRWLRLAAVLLVCGVAGAGGAWAEPQAESLPRGSTPISADPVPRAASPGGDAGAKAQGGNGLGKGDVVPVAELRIDLSEQRLSAFDGEHRLLYRRLVSTGLPASPTPSGTFTVTARFPTTSLTGRDYKIPSVPNVLCLGGGGLQPESICIHPAPWQEAAGEPFGVRRSHGCVRTSSSTARWLFERTAVGTPVIIQP
jgi:hypothetical protein